MSRRCTVHVPGCRWAELPLRLCPYINSDRGVTGGLQEEVSADRRPLLCLVPIRGGGRSIEDTTFSLPPSTPSRGRETKDPGEGRSSEDSSGTRSLLETPRSTPTSVPVDETPNDEEILLLDGHQKWVSRSTLASRVCECRVTLTTCAPGTVGDAGSVTCHK